MSICEHWMGWIQLLTGMEYGKTFCEQKQDFNLHSVIFVDQILIATFEF